MAGKNATEADRNGLRQIAPGVYVDTTVTQLDPERKYLLLDEHGYKQLGLTSAQHWTMLRLFEAEMIRLYRCSPRVILLDVGSWREHMQRVVADPWFWEDQANLRRYRGTYER